jgi:hypothetical protein
VLSGRAIIGKSLWGVKQKQAKKSHAAGLAPAAWLEKLRKGS